MKPVSPRKQKHVKRHQAQKEKEAEMITPAARRRKNTGVPRAVFVRGIKGTDSILGNPLPQIAFVGRSNVGKSSTLNAILGVHNLAHTSGTPGKTQEINFFMVNDNTFFVDLPGYGYAKLPEKIAAQIRKHILWYLTGGETRPKLVVLILDARVGATEHDQELMHLAREHGHPLLVLLNKIDKLNASERTKTFHEFASTFPEVEFAPFSAKTKEGVKEVRERIFRSEK